MDVAKSETFKSFIVLNKALLFLMKKIFSTYFSITSCSINGAEGTIPEAFRLLFIKSLRLCIKPLIWTPSSGCARNSTVSASVTLMTSASM